MLANSQERIWIIGTFTCQTVVWFQETKTNKKDTPTTTSMYKQATEMIIIKAILRNRENITSLYICYMNWPKSTGRIYFYMQPRFIDITSRKLWVDYRRLKHLTLLTL